MAFRVLDEERTMKRSRYSDEQMTYALLPEQTDTTVADVCRRWRLTEATFSVQRWHANREATEFRELSRLREEESKLKRLVADLTLDKYIL